MRQFWHPTHVVQMAAAATWVVLAILSLLPVRLRPDTGAGPQTEHAIAYFLAGIVTRAGFTHVQSRWQIIAFSIAAAVFELCQWLLPERQPRLSDWLTSTLGAACGIILIRTVLHHHLFGL